MKKIEMARRIHAALYNLPGLPSADHGEVVARSKKPKDVLEAELAMARKAYPNREDLKEDKPANPLKGWQRAISAIEEMDEDVQSLMDRDRE